MYFAYGSNLNLKQMRRRCPTAQPVCAYRLLDWRLVFRGYADIVPCPAAYVDGALYQIGPRDLVALDRYERYNAQAPDRGLYRREWLRIEVDDRQDTALVYVMNRNGMKEVIAPDARYFAGIVQGFRDWELPLASLYDAGTRAGDRFRSA